MSRNRWGLFRGQEADSEGRDKLIVGTLVSLGLDITRYYCKLWGTRFWARCSNSSPIRCDTFSIGAKSYICAAPAELTPTYHCVKCIEITWSSGVPSAVKSIREFGPFIVSLRWYVRCVTSPNATHLVKRCRVRIGFVSGLPKSSRYGFVGRRDYYLFHLYTVMHSFQNEFPGSR